MINQFLPLPSFYSNFINKPITIYQKKLSYSFTLYSHRPIQYLPQAASPSLHNLPLICHHPFPFNTTQNTHSPSLSWEMTRPNMKSDLLMKPPSFSRSPVAPDWETFSEPAKSTKLRWDTVTASSPPSSSLRSLDSKICKEI